MCANRANRRDELTILIAPWGQFKSFKDGKMKWSEVEYFLAGEGLEERSLTPLKLLHEKFKPQETLIFVLDTLGEDIDFESYDKLREFVRRSTVDFAKGVGIQNVNIAVLPGNRIFVSRAYRGDLKDYYYLVLYQLSVLIYRSLERRLGEVSKLKVVIDLTHGVNFMPVLTYEAVRQLLSVIAAFVDVELIAFNSEPFSGGGKKYAVFEVSRDDVRFSLIFSGVNLANILKPFILLSFQEKKELGKKLNNEIKEVVKTSYLDELNIFLNSFKWGMPLAMYAFFPDSSSIEDLLNFLLSLYWNHIDFNAKVVNRSVSFGCGFETLVKAWLVSSILRQMDVSNEMQVDIQELIRLTEGVIRRIDVARYYVTKNELTNIYRAAKDRKLMDKSLAELKGHFPRNPATDPRIFVAHAGLEENITHVKSEEGKIYLYYDNSEVLKKVLKNIT